MTVCYYQHLQLPYRKVILKKVTEEKLYQDYLLNTSKKPTRDIATCPNENQIGRYIASFQYYTCCCTTSVLETTSCAKL